MITKFEIRPNTGSPVELNDLVYPLSVCEINTNMDVKAFKKVSLPGEWPSFAYPGALTAHVEGRIIGTGATPSEDHVTKRLALIDACMPPLQTLTTRKHGVLRVRLNGMTEDADTDIIVTEISIPMRALFPAISDFMISWKGFLPFFTGVTTPTNIYQLG